MNWENLTKPKYVGGIGLRNLEDLNKVCVMKLGWKITSNTINLWCNIMRDKYRITKNTIPLMYKGTYSSLLKEIVKSISELLDHGSWVVGDGKTINAWTDNWLGNIYV